MLAAHSDPEQPSGAYGFEVTGLPSEGLLVRLGAGQWPLVQVKYERSHPSPCGTRIDRERAIVSLGDAGRLVLDRKGGSVTIAIAEETDGGSLIHPVLATTGAIFAWWQGHVVLHGGAVVIGDGAWGFLGQRGSGKSSLLAGLALAGFEVVTDDVLVISGRHAFAGPRCLDLRPEPARLLGVMDRTRTVRGGQRHRLQLGHVKPELPLLGWISLGWGPELEVHPLGVAERLEDLASNLVALQQTGFLELGDLPAWRLIRPADWRSFQPAVEGLLELARSA